MAQEGIVIPPCDWLSHNTWDGISIYPSTIHMFINLATRCHDIMNFASGMIAILLDGKEVVTCNPGGIRTFEIPRSVDFMGKFAISMLLPSGEGKPASEIIKKVSLSCKGGTTILSGKENYQKAVEEGLWPWKTNKGDSRYFLIPLMFPGYIHSASYGTGKPTIEIQLEDFDIGGCGHIEMMLISDAIVLHNDLRINVERGSINKLTDISISDFAPNIKYSQPDKCEVMTFTDAILNNAYDIGYNGFNNDCKAIIVEITCTDPKFINKSLPVKSLCICFEGALAVKTHAVNAREYYWKLCKLPVPSRTSFILPFSHDLVTPHAASVNFTKLGNVTIGLEIHPDWKDVKTNVTITSIGHEAHQ